MLIARATGQPLKTVLAMPEGERRLWSEHLERYPPAEIGVVKILAEMAAMLAAFAGALPAPKPRSFLPWVRWAEARDPKHKAAQRRARRGGMLALFRRGAGQAEERG